MQFEDIRDEALKHENCFFKANMLLVIPNIVSIATHLCASSVGSILSAFPLSAHCWLCV